MKREIVFITGASSGLGLAFARHYAAKGYALILTGLPADSDNEIISEISQKYEIPVDFIAADFSIENDISKVETAIQKLEHIELLINNAGFFYGTPFLKTEPAKYIKMIDVHISAPLRFIHAALPGMIAAGKGTIIHVSSLSSFLPIPHDSVYNASKLFNNSLMESIHIRYRSKGIKVQVLCPGFVLTNFHERAGFDPTEFRKMSKLPWDTPERIVEISVRNLKKKNKVIVIPGFVNRLIKCLYHLLPQKIFYFLAEKYLC